MKERWLLPLIAANLAGAAYGFVFFYGPALWQSLETPWLLPFIPDCPLFTLLLALALVGVYTRSESKALNFLALAGALKYGFWTVFVLLLYGGFYFRQDAWLYTLLFWAHVGLFLQAFLLAGKSDNRLKVALPVLGFLWLSDLADYLWLSHPPLPAEGPALMFPASLAMSLAFWLLAWAISKKKEWGKGVTALPLP